MRSRANVSPGDTPGFPVTISQPGSYRLSSNLTVPDANTTAILITSDNVTLDLNGFSIMGPVFCLHSTPPGQIFRCGPVGFGVGVSSTGSGTTVLNGHVLA